MLHRTRSRRGGKESFPILSTCQKLFSPSSPRSAATRLSAALLPLCSGDARLLERVKRLRVRAWKRLILWGQSLLGPVMHGIGIAKGSDQMRLI
jgi:hypothetical protein